MGKPVVIVGDAMLDVDIEGSANRLSPEAPVPVVDAERIWHRPGGAGLAAVLAARADRDVVLVTALGDDADGRALMELLTSAGVDVVTLPMAGSTVCKTRIRFQPSAVSPRRLPPMAGSTVCKTRIRASGQSMLRVDHGDGIAAGDAVPPRVATVLNSARAVCVADYGHGVTAHLGIRALLTRVAAQVPIVWDPHPRGAQPTPGCWLVSPNQVEAEYFSDCTNSDAHSAETLRQKWEARAVCITLGRRGALLATDGGGCTHIPVPAVTGAPAGRTDTCGGGGGRGRGGAARPRCPAPPSSPLMETIRPLSNPMRSPATSTRYATGCAAAAERWWPPEGASTCCTPGMCGCFARLGNSVMHWWCC
jgi:bifunctional ADP-heptose synthase (sugar kinase/adenylyltransferase)